MISTYRKPFEVPRTVTRRSSTLHIQSFCRQVRASDRRYVITRKGIHNGHFGKWAMFQAAHIQCSQNSSQSIVKGEEDRIGLIVCLFGNVRTNCTEEDEELADYRGLFLPLGPSALANP